MIVDIAEQLNADTGFDLVAYFIAGIPATIGAITALYLAVRSLRHNAEIREQVSNDHDSNLRDDIDDLRDLVERLSAEIREDRITRRDADRRILAHVDDSNARTNEKLSIAVERAESVIRKHHPEDAAP